MSWLTNLLCNHDWVVIREPKHDDRAYSHKILHKDKVVHSCAYTGDAEDFQRKYSDFICSKCNKLELNMHKLDSYVDIVNSREKAKRLGTKLANLADKARE